MVAMEHQAGGLSLPALMPVLFQQDVGQPAPSSQPVAVALLLILHTVTTKHG